MSKAVKRSRTANRLILYIILFSSIITLFITSAQLYLEYRDSMNFLNKSIVNIKTGYRQGITNAVWLDDKIQLTAIIKGIKALPDIEYVEVKVNDEIYASSGQRVTTSAVSHTFTLQHEHDNKLITIGETLVEANLSGIYQHIFKRAWVLLGSNAFKTFLVALFMYFLFDRLVFRRLNQVSDFVRNHDVYNLNNRINIKTIGKHGSPDEINEIASALNEMQEHLSTSFKELLRLKTTLDFSLDGFVMFYPENYKFFYANTGAVKLFGYSIKELMNMTPTDICPDFNKIHFTRLIRQAVDDTHHALHIETTITHKQGSLIPVKLTLQYLDPENEEPRFILIARDITKDKKDEMMLLASLEDAKTASETKSKFLMSMSHELRTPLNAILGFSQLLELDAGTLTVTQNESVKDILKGGQHLLRLIEDILDLSRIESNNIILSLEMVDPVSLLDECVRSISPLATMKAIHLENKITAKVLPEISIDQTRFKQILLNLLSNAIKYNDIGGSVALVCELPENNIIRFKIIDTGYGIKESEQMNVFTPFNRLGHEAGLIEGTGIGLNITKRLVELMNGEINFESRAGEGSSFWVDFYYKKNNDPSAQERV